ncbi:MAG: hypothetical protein O7D91_04480 [Planctomycetota bacterium]|nr:hypothetical protein [Planctomycetota bacterium]
MRWIAVAAGVLLVASLVGSEEQAAEEESPLIFTLEVNGKPHPIKPGTLLTLPAHKGPLKVRLRVEPYRVFRIPGVEFRFPRGWHVERPSKWEPTWKLSSPGRMHMCRLYVWIERDERDPANVIEREIKVARSLADEEDFSQVIRNDRPLGLAGHSVVEATYYERLKPNAFGTVRTYYALRTGADTVLFTLWEMRLGGLAGKPSTEWKEMERWLQESLKVLPPTDK